MHDNGDIMHASTYLVVETCADKVYDTNDSKYKQQQHVHVRWREYMVLHNGIKRQIGWQRRNTVIAYLLAEILQRGYKCAVKYVPAEENLVG